MVPWYARIVKFDFRRVVQFSGRSNIPDLPINSWLRRVCRVGRLLLPLLPLYSFMHRSILLSSFHSCLYDCSPLPTIICGCRSCRSVHSRHFHVAFACISVAEIRPAYCTRSSDELAIQHVFWDAPVSHSMDMDKPSQTLLA